MKLQVNTSGAWRNVVDFDAEKKPEVMKAVQMLKDAGVLAKWCIVHDDERREWL